MDEINVAILNKINSLTTSGRYVVISHDEFADAMPDGFISQGALKSALDELIGQGYVDLKYSSGDLYCLSPLKSYNPPIEEQPAPEPEREKIIKPPFIATFAAAFLGGVAGSLCVELIALLC